MKKFIIIRHAESTANAGERTASVDSIPLSIKGRLQAEELAKTLTVKPDLIVVSPYIRTQQTAEPFIKKHPDVPVEIWDVHEFTYLAAEKYDNTNNRERFGALVDYWLNSPIDHRASEASESFVDFTGRIQEFLKKIQSRPEETIVVFSHGRFIKGLQLYMERSKKLGKKDFTNEELHKLKRLHAKTISGIFPVANASVHEIILD